MLFFLPSTNFSTRKIWPPYKSLRFEHHNIYKFIPPPDTHPKYATSKENYESFSRELSVNLFNDTTISSSKSPTSYVKLITYMHNVNGFELLTAIVFAMSPQLGGLGPKSQDLMIYVCLVEGENLPQFHLRDLHIRAEIFLLQDQTGRINNITCKCTMELS